MIAHVTGTVTGREGDILVVDVGDVIGDRAGGLIVVGGGRAGGWLG